LLATLVQSKSQAKAVYHKTVYHKTVATSGWSVFVFLTH